MRHRSILSGITLAAVVLAGVGLGGQSAAAAEPTAEPTTGTAELIYTPTPPVISVGRPRVDVITINGSGCPLSSGTAELSEERNRLVVEYSGFMAESGPGLVAGERRKNCQMMLDVATPDGYTYALDSVRLEGEADLPAGVTASVGTWTYFQGMDVADDRILTDEITGPTSDDWAFTQQVPTAERVFKPCGEDRLIAVNTTAVLVGVTTGTTEASVSVERFSNLKFSFVRC